MGYWVSVLELMTSREKLVTIVKYFENTPAWADNEHRKKLNQLSVKYFLGFCILFFISIAGNYQLAGFQARQMFVWTYYCLFLILRMLQFSIAFEMIKLDLDQINRELLELNRAKYCTEQTTMTSRLVNTRQTYEKTLKITELINSSSGFSIMSMSMLMACASICTTYWMVLSLLKNIQIINSTILFCQVFPPMVLILMITKPCQACSSLVSNWSFCSHCEESNICNITFRARTSA